MIGLVLLTAPHADPGMPPATTHAGVHASSRLAARDGAQLWTRWILPAGEGPFPTIVTRVPYPMDTMLDIECGILVRRGYACVYQHVRGRGRSEGEWEPFVNDEHDGQDLVAWIGAQGWSNGTIGWLGDSYLAATGWTVATGDPDGVDVLVSRVFAPALYASAYESGLLRHELITAWMAMMPDSRKGVLAAGRYHRALRHRPRTTLDLVAAGHPVEWYRGWLTGEDPSAEIWTTGDAARFDRAPEETTIPVMLVGGWSDAFVEAQVQAWGRLANKAESLLVIGPWSHIGQVPTDIPLRGVDGPGGGGGRALQFPRVLDWLDVHLRGATPAYAPTGAVTYVIGGDRWELRPDWPPATEARSWSAAVGGDRCDGALIPGVVSLAAPLPYTYDPEDPLPSHGGAGLLAGAIPFMNGVRPGFVRAPDHCGHRADVLRFTSAPLAAPLHLAGTVRVDLDVASDAADTAFGFRLLERRVHGPEVLLREGYATLALRDGPPRRAYTPGERVTLSADGAPLEAEVHAGSELVLVVTSSSFPAYEAHPNVAGLLAAADHTVVAHQVVYGATLVVPEVVPEVAPERVAPHLPAPSAPTP